MNNLLAVFSNNKIIPFEIIKKMDKKKLLREKDAKILRKSQQ